MSGGAKPASLEERLSKLREQMEEGFPRRAAELRFAADRLARGEAGARDEIRRLAHRLRGTAGSYGHAELGEQAGEVEGLAATESEAGALITAALALVTSIGRVARDASTGVTPPQAKTPSAAIAIPTLVGRKLLAIDDDASTRKLLELTLATMGRCDARIVEAPEDALALLERERFDLAIVDAMMPGTTGLALAVAMRAREHGAQLPIAFLSAASQDELGWTLPASASWHRKPFRPRELLEALVRILGAGDDTR